MLLGKLKVAQKYTEIALHGTMKLTAYFGVMSYCIVSRAEKLMVSDHLHIFLWSYYFVLLVGPRMWECCFL